MVKALFIAAAVALLSFTVSPVKKPKAFTHLKWKRWMAAVSIPLNLKAKKYWWLTPPAMWLPAMTGTSMEELYQEVKDKLVIE